jgi:uncharacterized membrane protein YeaQ/YmgE (transglycosylase-associated protein family)
LIGALILGLVAGFIGRALVPNDIFSGMRGPASWAVSVLLGLAGAFVGYLIFTRLLGIGDDSAFDLGGIVSAIIGVLILLIGLTFIGRRTGAANAQNPPGPHVPGAARSTVSQAGGDREVDPQVDDLVAVSL